MNLKTSVLITILIFITGCVGYGAPAGFTSVPSGMEKMKLGWEGIEFLPPQSSNWSINREGYTVVFGKRDSDTHTYIASISYVTAPKVSNPQELVEIVKQQWDKDSTDPRYEMEYNNTILDPRFSNYSTKHNKRYKDKSATNVGSNQYLMLEDYGYAFIHPYNPDVMVTVLYSERFAPGEQKQASIIERENFVQNIRVLPFSK